jgi:uncharacterized protein
MQFKNIFVVSCILLASQVQAQDKLVTAGTVVMVPASAQVSHPNEIAIVSFGAMLTGKDKAELTSRVNQKMKEGVAILRAVDPGATLQTGSFYNVPQYKKEKRDSSAEASNQLVGWEISQSVTVTTRNLALLPKMALALQDKLDVGDVRFKVSDETMVKLRERRIAATYASLNETIAAVAKAMGKSVGDATLESVTFDGAGERNPYQRVEVTGSRIRKQDMAEPVFEAGESTLEMSLVGKVKFK